MISANPPVTAASSPAPVAAHEPARAATIGGHSGAVQHDAVVRAAALQRVPGTDMASQAEALRKRRRSYRDPFTPRAIHHYEDVQDWENGFVGERGRFLDLVE
jgi:hypothetical protein